MKSINKKLIGVIVVTIIVVAAILAYIKINSNTHKDSITVGVIAPLTGQYGVLGESLKNAVELAVGNDSRIRVVFEDDQFDGKTGLSAFHKLVDIDNVDLIINESSPTLEAITPIVAQSHLPVIQIFEAKEHKKDSVFQMLPFSYALFSDLARLAEIKYKRISLVYGGNSDVLATDAGYFKSGVISSSTIVNETKIIGNSDFRSEVTKILAYNPDAVTGMFMLSDGIKFIKELNAQKGNKKIALICDANVELAINDYIKALGTSTFEGCVSTNLPNLMTDSFKSAYKTKYNADPVIGADWGYDSITIVRDLLSLPKDQWLNKIQSESFEGVSGHVSFDENGTRGAISERHVFKDGKFVKSGE